MLKLLRGKLPKSQNTVIGKHCSVYPWSIPEVSLKFRYFLFHFIFVSSTSRNTPLRRQPSSPLMRKSKTLQKSLTKIPHTGI